MKKSAVTLVAMSTFAGAFAGMTAHSWAVKLTNSDAEERVVMVTEKGTRTEVALSPNSSVSVCEKGCFMAFPSGDMLPLKGVEAVVVENGKGRIVNK